MQKPISPWFPLSHSIFRRILIAAFVSNIGTWMHEVGAAWLMTSLTTKPLLVALVQAASTFPIFLLALPAGALADILDRRLYLLMLQLTMAIIAAALTAIVYFHLISPISLLCFTFGLGICSALIAPAWQAFIPELVPSNALTNAVSLASAGSNLAKGIGPAIGGLIISAFGPVAVFGLNAISFLVIVAALASWRREAPVNILPAERLFGAMRAGLRYFHGSPVLHYVVIRTFCFFVLASAVWALLPLVVRAGLGHGPESYGLLLGLLGGGTMLGAFLLPSLRLRFSTNQLINLGTLFFSMTTFLLALSKSYYLICLGMVLGGVGWIMVLATLNAIAQMAVAVWVRARALAIYLVAFFGGMAVGSILWGHVATVFSIHIALFVAAVGLSASTALTYFFSIEKDKLLDHTPTGSPMPQTEGIGYHRGPVMITVEYKIGRDQLNEFVELMRDVRLIRLREGAFFWNLFHDVENKHRFVECFMVESWLEHIRQHERFSISDQKILSRINALHRGPRLPKVEHFVASELLGDVKQAPSG